MLTMQGVSKSFLGVRVLHDVGLDLEPGEVHAVVGENGAGKSTLMKILAGEHTADTGTITLDGTAHTFVHPAQAQAAGIGIIHQEFALLEHRTVAENVFLGREPTRRGLVDRRTMERRTAELLAEIDETGITPRTPVRDLSVARQQTVEIVKALASDVRVLVMDEPTAPLADHEVELLSALVRRLTARGLGILYISHRLREVFGLARRITVLKDAGASRPCAPRTPASTRSYGPWSAGTSVPTTRRAPARRRSAKRGSPSPAAATTGSGASTSPSAPAKWWAWRASRDPAVRRWPAHSSAAAPFTTGTMTVGGAPLRPARPRQAVRGGIALVTEDRKAEGLALRQSVRDNALLVTRASPPATGPGRQPGDSPPSSNAYACTPTGRTSRSSTSPAATSRKSSSPSGWRPAPRCSSSTNRPGASTSGRRPRSTPSCASSPAKVSPY